MSIAGPARILCARRHFLIRRNRRWTVHLLSLALFFAQLGVVLHASTHFKADSHPAQLCAQCLSSAPLQSMAGGGATIVANVQVAHVSPCERQSHEAVPQRGFTGFRSRAPPALS